MRWLVSKNEIDDGDCCPYNRYIRRGVWIREVMRFGTTRVVIVIRRNVNFVFPVVRWTTWTFKLKRLPHKEWFSRVVEQRAALALTPNNLCLAIAFWNTISGSLGYDIRSGKRAIETFQSWAFNSEDGLAELLTAFRKLAADGGELPDQSLFNPPLENLLRLTARHSNRELADSAAWILGFFDTEPQVSSGLLFWGESNTW